MLRQSLKLLAHFTSLLRDVGEHQLWNAELCNAVSVFENPEQVIYPASLDCSLTRTPFLNCKCQLSGVFSDSRERLRELTVGDKWLELLVILICRITCQLFDLFGSVVSFFSWHRFAIGGGIRTSPARLILLMRFIIGSNLPILRPFALLEKLS